MQFFLVATSSSLIALNQQRAEPFPCQVIIFYSNLTIPSLLSLGLLLIVGRHQILILIFFYWQIKANLLRRLLTIHAESYRLLEFDLIICLLVLLFQQFR
jgi:hypothetical protein